MSFAVNDSNQLSFADSTFNLTDRETKFLEKSWAKPFAENIFPAIKEEDFAVLYSCAPASRPNTPVNVIVGSMILKELLGISDDEVMQSLMFDIRFQYALHTTSYQEQPLSDRTLSRFRERCLNYEAETGIDLVKNCVLGLSGSIAELMGINTRLKRMDSMMVASNIKRLSRLELIYVCVANAVNLLHKLGETIQPELRHYLEENDRNNVIYRTRSEDLGQRVKDVLRDAALLTDRHKSAYVFDEFKLLARALKEQTVKSADGSLAFKEKSDPTLDSTILQSPADPDATYRHKSGKGHRGYAANLIEDVDDNKSIISDYDYRQNIQSDSQFLKETVDVIDEQEETLTLIADGAYGGEENIEIAKNKNIKLITTNMQGKKPEDIFADFEFSPDGKEVLRCAGGQTPHAHNYNAKTQQCRIALDRKVCEGCPFKEQCKPKFHKTKTSLLLSWKSAERAKQLRYMKTEEFIEMAKLRNGVESLPSILRRKYSVDRMPVRGKARTKLLFGFKIAAINFKKLFDYQNSLAFGSPNPNFG